MSYSCSSWALVKWIFSPELLGATTSTSNSTREQERERERERRERERERKRERFLTEGGNALSFNMASL